MAVFLRRSSFAAPASPPRSWGVSYLVQPDADNAVLERVRAAAEKAGEEAPKPAAAAEKEEKNTSPEPWATTVSAGVFVVALVGTVLLLFGTESLGPTYKASEGFGAFALFYIVAQAAERLVEMVLPYLDRRPGGKNEKVASRNRKLVAAVGGDPDPKATEAEKAQDAAQVVADAQADVDQMRANRTALVFGCTAAIGMVLCGYLEADFLSAVGVSFGSGQPGFVDELLLMAVTGLIVGGGSKALHDTISNISKASEKKDTPAQTGGTP